MPFKTEILKTGKNKFDVGDMVVGNHDSYEVICVYNDFTYSLRNLRSSSYNIPVVSDNGFRALSLKRIVIVEKIIIQKYSINPYTGEVDLKYNPQYIHEDFYFTIRA